MRVFCDKSRRDPELMSLAVHLAECVGNGSRYYYNQAREAYRKRALEVLGPVKMLSSVPHPTQEDQLSKCRPCIWDRWYDHEKTLTAGDRVGVRLDIPSYCRHGLWVNTVHQLSKRAVTIKGAPVIGYGPAALLRHVTFSCDQKVSLRIAQGQAKSSYAALCGAWVPCSLDDLLHEAEKALLDPSWRQVGMNPLRHSLFYDRQTEAPCRAAREAIIVGPLVLARHVTSWGGRCGLY